MYVQFRAIKWSKGGPNVGIPSELIIPLPGYSKTFLLLNPYITLWLFEGIEGIERL